MVVTQYSPLISYLPELTITKTCPYNIQKFFSVVKIKNSYLQKKKMIFLILIVGWVYVRTASVPIYQILQKTTTDQ